MVRELHPRASKAKAAVALSSVATFSHDPIFSDSEPEHGNDSDEDIDLDMDDGVFNPQIESAESDYDSDIDLEDLAKSESEEEEVDIPPAKKQRVMRDQTPDVELPTPASPMYNFNVLRKDTPNIGSEVTSPANIPLFGQPSYIAAETSDNKLPKQFEFMLPAPKVSELKPARKTAVSRKTAAPRKSAAPAKTSTTRKTAALRKSALPRKTAAPRKSAVPRKLAQPRKPAQAAKPSATKKKPKQSNNDDASDEEDDEEDAAGTKSCDDSDEEVSEDEEIDMEALDYNESDEDEDEVIVQKPIRAKKQYNFEPGYNASLPPLHTIEDIFADLAQALIRNGMKDLAAVMGGRALKIGTFCSGTEAPILAMKMLRDNFLAHDIVFNFQHMISAEIHPWKSAFIERNFPSSINGQDITQLSIQRMLDPMGIEEWVLTTAYGGEAKVPGNLDILVAGFACDDFSNLNGKRKTLEAKGESGDTFFAILNYVERYHPKMVVLENVIGAPWVHTKLRRKCSKEVIGIDEHFRQLGYVVCFMKLDTKDHYLPHTRQRGYMVCVWPENFNGGITGLEELATRFFDLVKNLKRPASVPMEAILLPFDSPLLEVVSSEDVVRKRAVMPWEKCKLGHQEYILDHNLGTNHPITYWDPNGFKVLPDYYLAMAGITDRILDSIDISHLRNILYKMIDDRYYNRFLELSQNVYRYEDQNRVGLIGCVTPSNYLFLTQRGGRVAGIEALISQGYNPNAVDITNMSENLLLDMSGNAMTSTVVGTFMFAALIHFRDVFNFKGRPEVKEDPEPISDYFGDLESHASHPASYDPISFAQITALAKATVRMCVCEGRSRVVSRQLQQCKVCKTTSCVKCGKNPIHEYEPHVLERNDPVVFSNIIKKVLPFSIDLSALFTSTVVGLLEQTREHVPSGFTLNAWNHVIDKIHRALSSTVSFRGIRRAERFHVLFSSAAALLKLEVSLNSVEWQLFVNVPDEPLSTTIGKFLRRFPIARMSPTGEDIMKGPWQFWNPRRVVLPVAITSSGHLQKSFENERGLMDFSANYVYSNISISMRGATSPGLHTPDILGDYVRHPECGQAWNSLHSRNAIDGQKPMLLFFHHHMHSGNPADHFFSFSNDVTRKTYGEKLAVVCNLPTSWRQPVVTAIETTSGVTVGGIPVDTYVGSHTENVDIVVDGQWVDLPNHELDLKTGTMITYRRLPEKTNHAELSCGLKRAIFEMKAPTAVTSSALCRVNRWTEINRTNKTAFWKDHRFMLEKELVLQGHRESDKSWIHYHDSTAECLACAPPPPSMQWTFNVTKTRNGKINQKQVPIENPEQASRNEQAMKSRPSAIQSLARLSSTGDLEFKVGIDPVTLVHRARAALLSSGSYSRTGSVIDGSITTSYRIVTDNGKVALPPPKQFTLRSTDGVAPNPKFVDPNSPFKRFSDKPVVLAPEQAKVLTWMLSQENNTVPFTEERVSEAVDDDLGYRVEAKATRKVKIAGGILSHGVGFGKTILILSIIAQNLKTLEDRNKNAPHVKGAIPTKATLVLVPPHLVDQWHGEAKHFMNRLFKRSSKDVIVIKNFRKIRGLTIRDYKNAKLVIAGWDVCNTPSYRRAFAQIAGKVECDDKLPPRAQQQWYNDALKMVESNLEQFLHNPVYTDPKKPNAAKELIEAQFEEGIREANQHSRYVPSKHVTGSKYVSAETRAALLSMRPQPGQKRKRDEEEEEEVVSGHFQSIFNFCALAKKGVDSLDCPLFEFMDWARIVFDEHTYAKPEHTRIFNCLKGQIVWALSGTPRLDNFHDVKAMASLLGVDLGRDDHTIMSADALRKKMSQLTSSEKFFLHQETASIAWQRNREEYAQTFLDHFVRQDFLDLRGVECKEFIVGVSQNASEKAMYMELEDYVIANDFQRKASKSATDSKAKHIKEATSQSEDGRVALFLKASAYAIKIKETDRTASDARQMCEIIEDTRRHEYSEMLHKFYKELTKAQWLSVQARVSGHECVQYDRWLDRAPRNHYGDHYTTVDIQSRLGLVVHEYDFANWTMFYRSQGDKESQLPLYPDGQADTHGRTHLTRVVAALRVSASKLNKNCEELVTRKRSLRTFQNVRRIQSSQALSCHKCRFEVAPHNATLLGQCGHIICSQCSVSTICGVLEEQHKCNAFVAPHQRIPCASLGLQASSDVESRFGSKIDYIVSLIGNQIPSHDIPAEDKVLVFVQYEKTKKILEAALETADITFTTLSNAKTSSKNLKNFQQEKDTKVLIMLTGDETAAGSNLTMARHVIFVQQLHTTGSSARQEYDAAMTQAIGRSRRLNQKGTVMVYEVLTTNTIEVDYRQHRGRCILKSQSGSDILVEQPAAAGSSNYGPLASSIAHLTQFDG